MLIFIENGMFVRLTLNANELIRNGLVLMNKNLGSYSLRLDFWLYIDIRSQLFFVAVLHGYVWQ